MKPIITVVIILIIFSACNTNQQPPTKKFPKEKVGQKQKSKPYDWNPLWNRVKKYKEVSTAYSKKSEVPKDFLIFYRKFISDSLFQKEHINFTKLIGVIGACEKTTVLTKSNWKFDDWEFIDEIGIDEKWSNTFYASNTVFFFEYLLKEVGTIRQLGFEKNNNKWYLTLYFADDC